MWISDPVDIEIARNTTTPVGFQFWDEVANVPLDITDFSFACRVAKADGESAIVTHSVEIVDAANGEYDVVFDGRSYGVAGSKERVTLSYQIIADNGSEPVTAQRGSIFLVPGIK